MSNPVTYQLANTPITAHAFGDNKLVICPNTNEAKLYEQGASNWDLKATLQGHDKVITSIDIAPNTNRIVTCSQDRNAYVWTQEGGVWKPGLVLLRINRAATFVRWSPNEDKFAVASGARCIAVCYFEEDNDWWASKHLKKPIRSTVLSIDWHPNNVLLAAGSADMKARVFSSFIKGLDKKPAPSVWGDKLPFNTVCAEFSDGRGGWVHSVAFSPSGDAVAFAGHDSTVNVAYPSADGNHTVLTVQASTLPFRSLIWANERQIVAAGFDCAPMLVETTDGQDWHLSGSLDVGRKKVSTTASVLSRFKSMDSRGQADQDTDLSTTHQNTIIEVRPYAGSRDNITQFSTCALDGKVAIWQFDPSQLATELAGLKLH
ncbi:actin-related protein 2 3 complex subunit [Lichtheimia corymbifera JMRC:FSU:9682]|uniref:Actin-related protein 2/3 complex subunit n=1 Tax=Lichtheimia corymbifera JMRC:FSU:9682 TaxID=1263082 RepID=A0A068RML9_9FUNG|nr:actin-related protein 2 3 complex subunit [Lichtheimia corymbifera JMRC:FSU:9682]